MVAVIVVVVIVVVVVRMFTEEELAVAGVLVGVLMVENFRIHLRILPQNRPTYHDDDHRCDQLLLSNQISCL